MKKGLLITIGILLALAIIVTWGYLFKYGKPKNAGEVFAQFGFSTGEGPQEEIVENPPERPVVTTPPEEKKALRQLTSRPVAGAMFESANIRYVEQGTGHVYEKNLETDSETLINSKTIPNAIQAVFSPTGEFVAIQYLDGIERKTILQSVVDDTDGSLLPAGATNIGFVGSSTLKYMVPNTNGSFVFAFDPVSEKTERLFEIPLRDVRVHWAHEYMYTIPTIEQDGYIYRLKKGTLDYVTTPARGLMITPSSDGIVTTLFSNDVWRSYNATSSDENNLLPIIIVPEKCVSQKEHMFCAVPRELVSPRGFPDNWYKGVTSFSDILWSVNAATRNATVLSNFETESGRQIDVYRIGTDETGGRIWFVNKNDNALWMFDVHMYESANKPPVIETPVVETATASTTTE